MFNKIKNYILYRNNETGRSMVEMLGVLAIIGVLTVGGLAGYNYAMEKNKVNELINGAIKRAVVVAGTGRTGTVSLDEFSEDTIAAGTFGNTATVSGGKITLTVSGVEEKICDQLKATIGENAVMAVVEECGTDPLTIVFNHDLQKGVSAEGTGNTENTGDEMWVPTEGCAEDDNCTDGKVCRWTDKIGVCVETGGCEGEGITVDDACLPCNVAYEVYDISADACNCSNRMMIKDSYGADGCVLKNCPTGYIKDPNGNCIPDPNVPCQPGYERVNGECVEACQPGYVRDMGGTCVPCSDSSTLIDVNEDSNCESVCDNRILIENGDFIQYYCMVKCNTGYILDWQGNCISCDESSGSEIVILQTGRDYCEMQCSNRERRAHSYYPTTHQYCTLK